jgi:hypothetical protein
VIAMTQDPGYVVRGEVVPDEETEELQSDQSGPMTRLRKVASAMRGDKPDQTVPNQTATTSPDTQDPNGSWPTGSGEPGAMSSPVPEDEMADGEYADATRPNDVSAVRSPQDGNGDYWDDEQNMRETGPARGIEATVPDTGIDSSAADPDATASDPAMTGASTYGTTEPMGTGGTVPAPAYESQAGTATGYNSSPADTGFATTGAATTGAGTTGAGTTGAGTTGAGTTGVGTTEGTPAGKHAAAAAADAGLRPGEATDRLGDFGDIAFGNLLPDAAQYSAQWQQIQFRFVDDPQASVTEAADVLSQVTAKLEAAIQERQRAIEERKQAIQERASALRGRWGEGSNADTETLRETLRMYRAFMDQLIGSTS